MRHVYLAMTPGVGHVRARTPIPWLVVGEPPGREGESEGLSVELWGKGMSM